MTPLEILEFYEDSIEREEGKEPCVTINADDYAAVLTGFREAVEERDRLVERAFREGWSDGHAAREAAFACEPTWTEDEGWNDSEARAALTERSKS